MSAITPTERVRRARAAQITWGQSPVAARCTTLKALREEITAKRERIIEVICGETGKPALDALSGDVMVALEQIRFYELRAARILKNRRTGKPSFLFAGAHFDERFEPHGVALIYAPANYPFQLAVVPMVTALFAGNATILKCSEKTPLVGRLIADLCKAANLPEDLVQVIDDAPESAAAYIEAGPDFLFFTGSTENGRSIAKRAAEHLIPAVLELGGKDAAIVFADCNVERAVEGIVYGAFSNAGQVCVGTKRLYVEHTIYPDFVERLVRRMEQLRVGLATDSDLGPFHGEAAQLRLIVQVQNALHNGATVRQPHSCNLSGSLPMLLTNVRADSRILLEETFGPALCVAPFHAEAEAIALANSSLFALSASVWTRDLARGRRVASAMNAGSCAVNDVIRNIANPHASFGGNRQSGYGRYHGAQGLYTFSRIKSVMVTNGKKRREINWFPFTQATVDQLNMFLGIRHGARGWLTTLRRFNFFFISLCIIPSLLGGQQKQGHLLLHVTTPLGSHGSLAYLIFASANGFPNDKEKALRSAFAPTSVSPIDAGELPAGRYAVSVYQDVNGNERLDTGVFGIPKEPVGVSNNPKPGFRAPRFDECSFEMGSSDRTISISLVHPK